MSTEQSPATGPDLVQGVRVTDLADGAMLVGHVGAEAVLLARRGVEFFAIDAACTHYHGPLAEGIIAGDTVRCPWHHACFSLRTGEALRAPALSPVGCWAVEVSDGKVHVRTRKTVASAARRATGEAAGPPPGRIVIVGGGAAGFAAAEMLRRERFEGSIMMLSDEAEAPLDRPNLSKDFLAGTAPEDWLPLRPPPFYAEHGIDLRLGARVAGIDPKSRAVTLGDGQTLAYDRLLLATGAEPNRLPLVGSPALPVYTLRSLADCRAILERASGARRATVVGASFIGLEVAAALRTRSLEVDVVAPEARPMERILGPQMGDFVRRLHEEHGVRFHLGESVQAIDGGRVVLKSGRTLEADLIVAGVGVRPRTELAQAAGLAPDRGVAVDAYLETRAPGIYAAGDIARWPDPRSGEALRVEHWVVAQRQGQTAARNMLGHRERFDAVPFFWSQHYDVPINYVGHAESWDRIDIDGDLDARDCTVRYLRGGRVMAVASIFRDADSLKAELALERQALPA